jgi:hypothetical protein
MHRFPIILTLSFLALSLCVAVAPGCSSSTTEPVQLHVTTGIGGLVDPTQALVVSVEGLTPQEFPVVIELLSMTDQVASMARLSADAEGKIEDFILAYDVGLGQTLGDGGVPCGTYRVRLTSSQGTFTTQVTVPDSPYRPIIWTCDSDAAFTNGFETGTPVFVAGEKLTSGKTYRIWPVKDRRSWLDGDTFKSWQKDYPSVVWPAEIPEYIEVQADPHGNLDPVQLLPYATKLIPGVTDQFDIVLDAVPYGVFNAATDAVDGNLPTGAVVQDHNNGGPIITELACRKNYEYTNLFVWPEPVYIWLNPGVMITTPHAYVNKYIVNHQDTWIDGDPLMDITGGAESDVVQYGCANEGLVLVWAEPEIGQYDAIVDMNANGVYDEGTDVLDWGAGGPGFRVAGAD